MNKRPINLQSRINVIRTVLPDVERQKTLEEAFSAAKGDWINTRVALKDKLPEDVLHRVEFVNSVAELSEDNIQYFN